MAYIQIPAFEKTDRIENLDHFVVVIQGKEYLIPFRNILQKLSNNQVLSQAIFEEINSINNEIDYINGNINNPLKPVSISDPEPVANGVYLPTEDGVYSFGLEKDVNNGFEVFIKTPEGWSKETYPVSVSSNGEIEIGDIRGISGDKAEKELSKIVINISELRLRGGRYEGELITLLGYYERGDKKPLNYRFTSIQGVDDGGSVINSTNGSWLAVFGDTVNIKDFGASNALNNNLENIQKAVNFGKKIIIDKNLDLKISITKAPENNETPKNGIQLITGTRIKLNGIIRLNTCDFNAYDILGAYDCKDVYISGNGKIIGDVETHVSLLGEHGMGIIIYDCDKVLIKDISITKCFADGLILHGKASNVSTNLNKNTFVKNVIFEDNRRQGVSILKCDFAVFTECTFKDTGKTKFALPACGMDIEPEWYQEAKNIKIDKCLFTENASMGLFIHSNDHTKNIFNVNVTNNRFESSYESDAGGRSLIGISKALNDEFSFIQDIKIVGNTFAIRDYNRNIIDVFNNVRGVDINNNNFINEIKTTANFNVTCIALSQVQEFNIEGNRTNFGYNFLNLDGNQSKNITVKGNSIKNITNKCLIIGTGSKSIDLINNRFQDSYYGIQASGGIEDLNIIGNSFVDISRYAMYLSWGVSDIILKENKFKRVCSGNSPDAIERNIISLYGDASARVSNMIVSDNIFNNSEVTTDFKYIGRNLSNIDNYIFKDNIFTNDINPSTKIDLVVDSTRLVSTGVAEGTYYGFVKKGVSVPNDSNINDLLASLRNAGIINN